MEYGTEYSDFVLKAEGKNIPVHRFFISRRSKLCRNHLSQYPTAESVPIPFTEDQLMPCISWMYSPTGSVFSTSSIPILVCADFLQLDCYKFNFTGRMIDLFNEIERMAIPCIEQCVQDGKFPDSRAMTADLLQHVLNNECPHLAKLAFSKVTREKRLELMKKYSAEQFGFPQLDPVMGKIKRLDNGICVYVNTPLEIPKMCIGDLVEGYGIQEDDVMLYQPKLSPDCPVPPPGESGFYKFTNGELVHFGSVTVGTAYPIRSGRFAGYHIIAVPEGVQEIPPPTLAGTVTK